MEDETPHSGGSKEEEANAQGKLTARQQLALQALLLCPSIKQAAQQSKIGETTLHRFLSIPLFSEAYQAARDVSMSQALSVLQSASGHAVTTLLMLMAEKHTGSVRLGAARSLLEFGLRAKEMTDILVRIEALEEQRKEP